MPFVYILRCADDSFYVGLAEDVESRLAAHNEGRFGGYTSTRRPVTVVHVQEFPTYESAYARERQPKDGRTQRRKRWCAGMRKP